MAVHLHRLKRTDKPGQHLLVHISSSGSKPLDLKLIGTEHEHLYHANIQESHVKSLQANTYTGNLQEWKEILTYSLLHTKPTTATGPLPTSLQGLESVAAISGKTLTITLRKNVEGITQRLGTLSLTQNDEQEEVSPFDWVDTAVATSDALRTELDALQAAVSGQQDEVARLTTQLDELVQAKREHEEELLAKFAALLNAKKLKIRDQQRLLAGAKVDAGVAEAVREARGTQVSTGRGGEKSGGSSRKGKRKAEDVGDIDDEEEEEDANAEDASAHVSEYDEVQQETPPGSEEEETEDEDDLHLPTAKANGRTSPPEKPAESWRQADGGEMDIDQDLPPPPATKEPPSATEASPPTTRSTRSAAPAAVEIDDDDDETDDEL